ncbi:hypothetical protein BD779DRAFT_80059 [Infundibulicybe gibba]|nr:hypothetical protein BD779DRAFT_80059 [Infundibulicybe gibba]
MNIGGASQYFAPDTLYHAIVTPEKLITQDPPTISARPRHPCQAHVTSDIFHCAVTPPNKLTQDLLPHIPSSRGRSAYFVFDIPAQTSKLRLQFHILANSPRIAPTSPRPRWNPCLLLSAYLSVWRVMPRIICHRFPRAYFFWIPRLYQGWLSMMGSFSKSTDLHEI